VTGRLARLGLTVGAAVGIAAGASLVLLPMPAHAASSPTSGWWTSAPFVPAADVTDDRLLVQGGADPDEPLAYAGISFVLAAGEVPSQLVLSVAPASASTPASTLALCRLTSSATPAAGEPAAEGPAFGCATRVESAPSPDGTTYTFAVDALGGDGALDVAVLPTQPTDRVVLAKPGPDALEARPAPAPPTGTPTTGTVPPPSPGAGVRPPAVTAGSGFGSVTAGSRPLGTPSSPAPTLRTAAPEAAGEGDAEQAAAPAAGSATFTAARPLAETTSGSASRMPFVFVGLAAAAAALWALAGGEATALETGAGKSTA
jgi:hypothetical protein